MVDLSCVRCAGALQARDPGASICTSCGHVYRTLMGITDLRTSAPPYLSLEADWEHATALAERFHDLDFAGLVRYKYERLYPEFTPQFRDQETRARLVRADLAQTRRCIVSDVLAMGGRPVARGHWLDIGCGTGPFVTEMASRVEGIVGVDITMEELILALKRVEDAGHRNVQFVAASAERLPFADQSFGVAHAMDVIEHVRDPVAMVREALRVLHPGGTLSVNSPNRLDIRHPEPHVGVRFVGFWPRRLQPSYVRVMCGREYKEKRLLSLPELASVLRSACGAEAEWRIFFWYLLDPRAGGRTMASRRVRAVPGLVALVNRAWGLFVHQHEALAWRSGGPHGDATCRRIVPTSYGIARGG
jgi:ubiquinone/menaquinone biosynthesis C-methylase UbiE